MICRHHSSTAAALLLFLTFSSPEPPAKGIGKFMSTLEALHYLMIADETQICAIVGSVW